MHKTFIPEVKREELFIIKTKKPHKKPKKKQDQEHNIRLQTDAFH